jgi:acyl carrier protein
LEILINPAAAGRGHYCVMESPNSLKEQIKNLLVEHLMLQASPGEIGDDQPLFGPGGLGLDSVDALQLVVALDKTFGLKLPDPGVAKEVLHTVNTIAGALEAAAQEKNIAA